MPIKKVELSPMVRGILSKSTIVGNTLILPPGQLERTLYEEVNKALTALGGKWNKKAGGHVFPFSPSVLIEETIATGAAVNRAQTLQFFPTPADIAERLVAMAYIEPGEHVLEPSAGHGALIDAILASPAGHITAVELDPHNFDVLLSKYENEPRVTLIRADFLEWAKSKPGPFQKVIMNPPFSDYQDARHIAAAARLIKDSPSGKCKLVSIAGESAFVNAHQIAEDFRLWLTANFAKTSDLPPDAFKSRNTGVRTRIVSIISPHTHFDLPEPKKAVSYTKATEPAETAAPADTVNWGFTLRF